MLLIKGGAPRTLYMEFGLITYQTLGDCIEELIDVSYEIYNDLLETKQPTTIVCGGQSPSYYCLSMMNFPIYNPDLVDIVVLPHSKGGVVTEKSKQDEETRMYCDRLKQKDINLSKNNIVIIDGVHSGTGILALQDALLFCFPDINITKIAINAVTGVCQIKVDKEYILPCEPKFSDVFPRLVNSYHPRNFDNIELFQTELNTEGNPVAEMIIDISSTYPDIRVSASEWYEFNNIVTDEIMALKKIKEDEESLLRTQMESVGTYFKPIILFNGQGDKIYKCPVCNTVSGTSAVKNPKDLSLFAHNYDCINKYKIPADEEDEEDDVY